MKWILKRLLGRAKPPPATATPERLARPGQPFVAIGDVHGRADLLLEMDALIEQDYPGWPVVFLGDYIDRGEHSHEVLDLLLTVSPEGTPPVTCLMGNHESMMLDFLDDPVRGARIWLRNGGLQTLASFDLAPPAGGSEDPAGLVVLRDRLAAAMGAEMIAWLRARPLSWHSGNVWAVHAGADPDVTMQAQTTQALLWGHPRFRQVPRADGQWVVHGHTVVEAPHVRDGRIAVDTGAYATGRLSAAAIAPDAIAFVQTDID